MRHSRWFQGTLATTVALLACAFAGSCVGEHGTHGDHALWFVHATDPHVYLDGAEDPKKKPVVDRQQDLDENALSQFFQRLPTLPNASGLPAFLLITGDFGVDPCLIPSAKTLQKPKDTRTLDDCVKEYEPKKRDDQIEKFAALFAKSPVSDIYFVAGNNDLPFETADDAGLKYFNEFFQDVQTKLTSKNANVRLHNLTGCYGPNGGAISSCSSDIPGTPYRMIGFPSQSFKNKDTKFASNQAQQSAQYKIFRGLFDQAVKDAKRIIIVTHIPEMDDPYFLAQDRYAGVAPEASADKDKDNPRSPYSTWNVEKSLLDDWTKVLASDSVIAVLTGHLHDNHKEIYRRPYSWSTLKEHQLGYRKLFLAPPLSVKKQDDSPIQARGFSIVSLKDDHVSNRFYWFDGRNSTFTPDSSAETESYLGRRRSFFAWLWHGINALYSWFWNLDQTDNALERACILLVALLAAFLTVIAAWQIPPSDNPLARRPDNDKDKPAPDPTPFTSKFGKTVIAGLGGLLVTDVANSLSGKQLSNDAKCFYVVWFILFFFLLLIIWSLFRSIAEAVRSRIAVIHYPLARPPRLPRSAGSPGGGGGGGSAALSVVVDPSDKGADKGATKDWLLYWGLRGLNWFYSLRVPALTFFDTFINLIQGRNQTGTRAFSEAVIDQQKNVIRVADTIRKGLTDLLEFRVREETPKPEASPQAESSAYLPRVRVNISVLSTDQSSVFYISRAAGSGVIPFTKRSVAWVSVFTGNIRWYNQQYDDRERQEKIMLFDNTRGTIAGDEPQIMLASHYQERDQDYEAFVVIPVPWPQRAYGSKYVKGAIQISFRKNENFLKIWDEKMIAPVEAKIPGEKLRMYPSEHELMLRDACRYVDVSTALRTAVAVLGELLYGFNEIIYRNYIEPDQRT